MDEAHCCSEWGHDFRLDYGKLAIIRQQFPELPILAVTATATTEVAQDVRRILQIRGAELLVAAFDRPNLKYSVAAKPDNDKAAAAELVAFVRSCDAAIAKRNANANGNGNGSANGKANGKAEATSPGAKGVRAAHVATATATATAAGAVRSCGIV